MLGEETSEETMRVEDLMTTEVVTVKEDTPLKDAARLMAGRAISGLPVVDDDDRVVGMLTEADFVERTSNQERAGLVRMLFERDSRRLKADSVGGAMSRNVVCIEPQASHSQAARVMDRKVVKRLPVVDEDGHLLGIISRSDILSVFARPDDAIEGEIRHRIIGQVLALESDAVSVSVDEGRVELEGLVPAKTEAQLLADLVPSVDGVISVDSRVRYQVDDTVRTDESRPYGVPRPNW
jgi:CBS domain-containing protein